MKAYSLDLRERVVSIYESEQTTIKEVAKRFSVGETFVKKMLKQKRERGVVEAPRHGGGKPRALDEKHLRALRQWLKKEPDLTLSELKEKMWRKKRKAISVAALGATLQREGLTRKKSQLSQPNEITGNEPAIGDV